jgi:NhaP-type Na+/H+ or K+/H+ antiporter
VEALSLSLVLATIFGWCIFASRLGRAGLTAPIVFVAAGFLFSEVLHVLDLSLDPHLVKVVAEVTLVWVLFADASLIRPSQARRDLSLYARLLGVGFPLTVALGAVAAALLFGADWWAALLIGAALAPTDAALGAAVMSDQRVPPLVRRVLNVESGLNDGIATPVVLVAIAGVAASAGIPDVEGSGRAVLGLVLGLVAGAVIGGLGGGVNRMAAIRGWLSEELAGPAALALALLAYTGALLVGGNGFVAAFVGGLAFAAAVKRRGEKEVYFVEQTAALASMICWLIFGALALPVIRDSFEWALLGYAVLSLTVIRMLPVALALTGAGLDRFGIWFVGWFGPRGLASVIFALLALEDLHEAGTGIVAVIALTVLLSVVAHGVSAGPIAGRFPSPRWRKDKGRGQARA